jgi:hypothetical protein
MLVRKAIPKARSKRLARLKWLRDRARLGFVRGVLVGVSWVWVGFLLALLGACSSGA